MLPFGNEIEADYVYVGSDNNVTPGMGFTMKGVGLVNHEQRYDFRGRAYNGIINIPVQADKMTLSGNPYASAIDLKLVFADNIGLLNNIRFWDEDRDIDSHQYSDNRAGFGTWIPGTSLDPQGVYVAPTFTEFAAGGEVGGGFGTGGMYKRRNAPIGQGFLYHARTSGTVTVNNSHRVYMKERDANGGDFRNNVRDSDSGESSLNPSTPQMRIITSFDETHSRNMLLMFWEDSTNGYDPGLDAQHPMDGDHADAYFPINVKHKVT